MGGAIALEVARRGIARSPADRWAGGLSLAIPALGLNAGLIAVAGGADAGEALLRGLTVLVAVCPCALSIALPLARMRAARVAAGLGLGLRDLDAFAALASARSIVFDKTGTLTAGDLRVTALDPVPGVGGAELLALAARAETGIAHPIARAIVAAHGGDAGTGGQRHARGAEATAADGRRIRIGAGPVRGDGRSWLAVTVDGDPAGAIALSDTPAGEAGDVIAALRRRGLTPRIATGDGRDAALALARRIGLDDGAVTAGCSPSGKAGLLGGLAGPVVFVGDGVNDGPALAVADCGISVAGAHSAAAQTAGVVVTEGGLHRVVAAIDLSRRFRSVVRLNLGLALAYNAMIVPAALLGLLEPVGAALAMVASSLSVIANSARIGTAPSPEPAGETGHETGHRSPSGAFVRSGMDG
ncbi:hypothetical protein VY88_22645 [Azospirillum thiophilum]|uniref:ATPase P n=1 Tax=Azospirillum thiophilum TaxID=528244 RepID=A0AAC8ZVD1_9PROT|nr:HAD-IC family P-type ATPase [Azospirillum thiophilum]ALG73613.1 hypothetical protein AL072_21815 [Azospirillum thiophilum]KJR63002.1 hypothetical protein VY88_22645 [Azospirillum thiophilum]